MLKLNIVATHTLRLGRHTCVAWAMFTGMRADWSVELHTEDGPISLGDIDMSAQSTTYSAEHAKCKFVLGRAKGMELFL
jgi:hypothetical protein